MRRKEGERGKKGKKERGRHEREGKLVWERRKV
jgi:hypothetical protein